MLRNQTFDKLTRSRFACNWMLATALAMVTGCGSSGGPSAIVQGTVTLDGELAESGSIVFHSDGDHPAAYGTINNDGSYSLRIGRGNTSNIDSSKIHPGQYTATVTLNGPPVANTEYAGAPPIPGPRLSAEKYAKKATSGLSYAVTAGRNVVNIAIESHSEAELQEILEVNSEIPETEGSAPHENAASASGSKADEADSESDGSDAKAAETSSEDTESDASKTKKSGTKKSGTKESGAAESDTEEIATKEGGEA